MYNLISYSGTLNVVVGTNNVNHQTGGMPFSWRFEDANGEPIPFAAKPDYANGLQLSRLTFDSTDAMANIKVFILAVKNTQQDLLPIL